MCDVYASIVILPKRCVNRDTTSLFVASPPPCYAWRNVFRALRAQSKKSRPYGFCRN